MNIIDEAQQQKLVTSKLQTASFVVLMRQSLSLARATAEE